MHCGEKAFDKLFKVAAMGVCMLACWATGLAPLPALGLWAGGTFGSMITGGDDKLKRKAGSLATGVVGVALAITFPPAAALMKFSWMAALAISSTEALFAGGYWVKGSMLAMRS